MNVFILAILIGVKYYLSCFDLHFSLSVNLYISKEKGNKTMTIRVTFGGQHWYSVVTQGKSLKHSLPFYVFY